MTHQSREQATGVWSLSSRAIWYLRPFSRSRSAAIRCLCQTSDVEVRIFSFFMGSQFIASIAVALWASSIRGYLIEEVEREC